MECPRCGGALTVYRLGGESSWVCQECGSVGVETEHGSEPERTETWEQALQRFYAKHVEPDGVVPDDVEQDGVEPDGVGDTDDGGDTGGRDDTGDGGETTAPEPSTETAAAALDDLEVPGDGETELRRRETVAELYAFLKERRTAKRSDFLEIVEPEVVSYASAEGFWESVGRDSLGELPGVTPPESGHHEWAFENEETEPETEAETEAETEPQSER
ncbi:small CPxCG-related zinc finger protein [Halalkaliarchaeum desulfuricum]|uniref:Small CPxCG-related zinc finger protein n=1 Tax=Halalkaliarchaeum desulfuricum TaxID=2055893 RepID=A0A343THK9_9EURY|nr:zf-TFIIB domain-containing protein [Halalkaliarchaeum desulfuricum]AUX08581.1 small CPxCG-related zinc finger protein [Halalkaliarchaeum desulfuricum]